MLPRINFCGVLTVLCFEIRFFAKRQNVSGNFMKQPIAYILILLSISCGQKKKHEMNWTSLDKYFQVYAFSDKVMGLTIELGYTTTTQNAIIDSIFNRFYKTDTLGNMINACIPIDTNGDFKFYRSQYLDDSLLNISEKQFYVYCTKGVVQRTIKDVVFSLDECKSNIVVFRFDPIDTSKYGYPIFCSRIKLPLTFGDNISFDKKIATYVSQLQYDYSDSIQSKTFAYSDTLFCTYSDNFNWNNSHNSD
jgi:hypothetical protein